ncbi:integrase [Spirosoma lacussanchae]|uniref:phage integrase SAM-like domain-containing protein n=1 Tax=Spirosoma lacussanchae TaxID=1884249 RepID=UPI001108F140|nr:phage integrase SAM-like domain-containing protein [Spirosoma lacussanchae]
MATYTIELNHKPNVDGRYSIFLRITQDRKHRRVKTGIVVKLSEFDKAAGYGKWIRSKHPDHRQLNADLKKVIQSAEQAADQPATDQVSQAWTLGQFRDKVVADASVNSVGFQRNLKSRLGTFVSFVGEDVPLKAVTLETLNSFKRHLQKSGKMAGTQHTYFNRIKYMFLQALRLDAIDKDPFRHFTMPDDKPAPRLKLTDQQVAQLEAVDVGSGATWLYRAKWLYLFSYQMGGIRSGDILQLRWRNVVGEESPRLEYQMSKTGQLMSTGLTPKAKQVLDLFRRPDQQPNDYLFGVLDSAAPYAAYITFEDKQRMPRALQENLFNQISSVQVLINRELKTLASLAELGSDLKLTFHTARHSFADRARRKMKESKNISIDDIRQALGHQRLDTTQRYLNAFDKEGLDSAMDAIFSE